MVYETSYDSGLKPFNPDKDRGKWSSPKDFIFACMGHTFKVDAMFVLPAVIFREFGIFSLIPHFIALGLCVAPIIFMQSFLGQFSSTGFISVFRISPLFKGIGYVSLLLNLITLTYHAVLGAVPIFYLFYSIRPSLPWSCEESATWMKVNENYTSICAENYTIYDYDSVMIPSVEFFRLHLKQLDFEDDDLPEASFSWTLMLCTFIIWGMTAAIMIKPIEMIGKFIRYSCLVLIAIIVVCVLRFCFLPGALASIKIQAHYVEYWPMLAIMAFSGLGPGWGSILTMASYNNFQTNIFKSTWILCLAQLGLMIGFSLVCIFVTDFMLRDDPSRYYYQHSHTQWMDFLMIPTGLTHLEIPHFWTFLFLGILILGVLNLLIVQLSSVLTSVFDEHEILRSKKREVTLGSIGFLAFSSIYFCSNHGISFFEAFIQISLMTQMGLNLLLIIVVLWVYGRERFQRDLIFMTNRLYPTWMVNIVRYVAPILIFFGWLFGLGFFFIAPLGQHTSLVMFCFIIFVSLLPWFLVPGYCVFKMMQTTGILGMRLRRCVRPTDWYPVDPEDRQRYEQALNNTTDISHQLTVEPDEQ